MSSDWRDAAKSSSTAEGAEQPWRNHWRRWGPPEAARGASPWERHGHPMRRVFVRRFIAVISLVLVLTGGWMAGLAYVLTRWLGGGGASAWLVWVGGMGLVLALPVLALSLAARVFRSYALPLADIMDAADAVANGDFTTRVEVRGSRDFKRLAASFNHMIEELARSDQQRRNLTADVAHELRTPLHIIRGNLEGILDGIYAPSPDHIEATLQETQALSRLVDDLRILSLAEAGELPLRREPVDVADLLADVVTSFSAQAEQAGLTLDAHVEGERVLTIEADVGRLDQVLGNLVNNAIRHTPSGGRITLAARRSDGRARITVADTGEGIPAADLPFIFDRFWCGDRARTHSAGASSGLGLAIAAQLVKAHGGTIDVESEVDQGTQFVIDLPIASIRRDGSRDT